MKSFFCILFALSALNSIAQTVDINKADIKFITGDNLNFANPAYEDTNWKNIKLGANWETQGYEGYDGYAWYRIKIIIPSALKAAAIENKGLVMNLGAIDDADISYFNGKQIGSTGGFPPEYYSAWNTNRHYRIHEEQVLWDKINVIAVRVYDLHQGGGMYLGPHTIAPADWKDNISAKIACTNPSFIFKEGQPATFSVTLNNLTGKKFSGTLKTVYSTDQHEEYGAATQPFFLEAGEQKTLNLSKQFSLPGFYEAGFQLKKNGDTATASFSSIFGYAIEQIKVNPDPQKDFYSYWQETRKELNNTNTPKK